MALVTLCPSCGTTYKIYPNQLQAQNGLVRCGKCQVIFNGFATLITIDDNEIEYQLEPVDNKTTSFESDKHDETANQLRVLRQETEAVDNVIQPNYTGAHQHEIVSQKATKSAEYSAPKQMLASSEPDEFGAPTSDFLADAKSQRMPQHWSWKYANMVLIILFVGQIIHAFRADLVVQFPQTRPYLEHYCVMLGCTVPLPENIQLLSIVSSDLQVKDPEYQPDVAVLTTVIRNHATYTQALPALKLLLTDFDNQILASRIVAATDYLSKEQIEMKAIQPHQEMIIQLYLDNSQLKSTGYQLQLLYL